MNATNPLGDQPRGRAPVASGVLLLGTQLGTRSPFLRQPEMGVVSESVPSSRMFDDRAFECSPGFRHDRPVRRRETHRAHEPGSSVVLGDALDSLDEQLVVGLVANLSRTLDSGEASTPHARLATERVDFQPTVVGEGVPVGRRGVCDRLDSGIPLERIRIFDRFGWDRAGKIVETEDRPTDRREDLPYFDELVWVAGGEKHLGHVDLLVLKHRRPIVPGQV